jgi:hypothetical protein
VRLLLGIGLALTLSACGGGGGGDATSDGTASPLPSVSLDTSLADAAERLASSLPSDLAGGVPSGLPSAPAMPTGPADATVTADPEKHRAEGAVDGCDGIWREGATLPSPYVGCADGDVVHAAEGHQGNDGVYYAYDDLCAGEGERIRNC